MFFLLIKAIIWLLKTIELLKIPRPWLHPDQLNRTLGKALKWFKYVCKLKTHTSNSHACIKAAQAGISCLGSPITLLKHFGRTALSRTLFWNHTFLQSGIPLDAFLDSRTDLIWSKRQAVRRFFRTVSTKELDILPSFMPSVNLIVITHMGFSKLLSNIKVGWAPGTQ